MLRRSMGAATLPFVSLLLSVIAREKDRREFQDTIEKFGLDASKREDVVAAYAYIWAQSRGSRQFGELSNDPGMPERVMRAAQADPDLFARFLAGNSDAKKAFTAAMQGPTPGSGIETHDDEEAALVAVMLSQGKTYAQIQNALSDLRAQRAAPTTEQRRNMPGVVVMTKALLPLAGTWLEDALSRDDGTPVPRQVAEKLVGKSFRSFRALREAVWRTVAITPELVSMFNDQNLRRVRLGRAPVTIISGIEETAEIWQMHHDPAIGQDGSVFDLSTIRIVPFSRHSQIHYGEK